MSARVLYFVEGWGLGGVESVIMDIVRSAAFQSEGYSFDIFCVCDWNNGYDDEIASLGGRRITVFPGERPGIKDKFRSGMRGFKRLLGSGQYDIAHINVTNGLGLVYADLARQYGINNRIVHSHNTYFDNPGYCIWAKRAGHAIGKILYSSAPTQRIACSQQAGEFVFGRKPFQVVKNGIDVNRFAFNLRDRVDTRSSLGIAPDVTLIGSIGKLNKRKNPLFQLRTFAEYLKHHANARFLMVGDGELGQQVDILAHELGVSDALIRVPSTPSPEKYYSALDALIMPSLTEGFGLVAVEAQCSGLVVLASEALPQDVAVTNTYRSIPLSSGEAAWSVALEDLLSLPRRRVEAAASIRGTSLDRDTMASTIVNMYKIDNKADK